MTFDEVFETLPTRGWLDKDEAQLLYDEVARTTGPVLEVGCYHGRSTALLAAAGRVLYCVDPFVHFDSDDLDGKSTRIAFLVNMARLGHRVLEFPNQYGLIELNERRIPEATIQLFTTKVEDWTPRPVGFAYLDGDHTHQGTLSQLYKALAGNPQAVGVHDVSDGGDGKGVRDACLSVFGRPWDIKVNRLAVWRQ